jgi:phosphate starvation-inducible PhoH-like protein
MVKKPPQSKLPAYSTNLFFEDNSLLPVLHGEQEVHLLKLETMLDVEIITRGNMLSITGNKRDVVLSEKILTELYGRIKKGEDIGPKEVEAAIRMAPPMTDTQAEAQIAGRKDSEQSSPKHKKRGAIASDVFIRTQRKTIQPYSHMQANYMRTMFDNDMVFALGPAGTGKTYIAVAMAVYMYLNNKVKKIILCRPAVEAGEKLGFLPGDIKEKIDPFLRPLYDALFDMLPAEKIAQMSEQDEIEVAPLAFMRGRTLSNAFVILDEAQNTTPTQMKMFLTRMGENTHMIITGDLSQTDLPKDIKSGLHDCIRKVENIDGIGIVNFSDGDVVRHPLAARIVQAYNDWDNGVRPAPKTGAPHRRRDDSDGETAHEPSSAESGASDDAV